MKVNFVDNYFRNNSDPCNYEFTATNLVILGGVRISAILRPFGGRLIGEEGGVGILFSFSFDVDDAWQSVAMNAFAHRSKTICCSTFLGRKCCYKSKVSKYVIFHSQFYFLKYFFQSYL